MKTSQIAAIFGTLLFLCCIYIALDKITLKVPQKSTYTGTQQQIEQQPTQQQLDALKVVLLLQN